MEHGLIISFWWAATPDRNMTRITKTKDLCWEADQLPPLVPSKKTYFVGYTVRSTMGGRNQVQRSCRLTNWNKVVRHSQNIQFYTCFISEFSWWNGTATHFVLPAVERQRWKRKQKERNRKRRFQHRKMYFQSLLWSQIKIPQVLWNMLPHEPSFVLLYSVCSYATLITKS